MSEDHLTADELQDRAWAVLAAAAEDRPGDVDELLVTLPWDDLVTVVHTTARACVTILAGPDGHARLADAVRGLLLERRAERERRHG
ncbi:hypothetical protein ABT264_11270 [Streptomyces virginiae]|uniref:hypothetical protein n=1 Tax=Streptomyces virginiae TaxID=1961 RepID=UPI0033184F2C